MKMAKLSARGQITIPLEIRRTLGLGPGDMVFFYRNAHGQMVMCKSPGWTVKNDKADWERKVKALSTADREALKALEEEARRRGFE